MKEAGVGALAALVLDEVTKNPCERDGHFWAAQPLGFYASALKVSVKTVGQWTRSPEFDRLDLMIAGKKTPLLRLKKPGDQMTATHCQRLLQKIFVQALPHFNESKAKRHEENIALHEHNLALFHKELKLCQLHQPNNKKALKAKQAEIALTEGQIKREQKKYEKAKLDAAGAFKLDSKQYGCLRGLVDAWGVVDAPDLLRMVLQHWSDFAVGTKVFIASEGEADSLYYRYFEYPAVTYILLFNHVALELAVMKIQEKGVPNKNENEFQRYKRLVDARNKQLLMLKQRLDLGSMTASDSLCPLLNKDY